MVCIDRICNIMLKKGERIFRAIGDKTKAPVTGKINFVREPNKRYARVINDPDYLFAFPGSDWRGQDPIYEIWVGDREVDAKRMLKAFDFVLSHEVVHTILENSWANLNVRLTGPDFEMSNFSLELKIDRATSEFFPNLPLAYSMISFTSLVIEDLKEKAIEVSNFTAAREIARLRWIENNYSLPLWLREKASKTVQDLLYLKSNFVIREWEKNYSLHQLSNICFEIFSQTELSFWSDWK